MKKSTTEIEFHYASMKLVPYKGHQSSSGHILRTLIQTLNQDKRKVIDRHENRKRTAKRRLVFIGGRMGKTGSRCFCKIALIKNKAPLLWSGKDVIEDIEKDENKEFIEVTNFVVDFNSKNDPIIMHEFNHEGPRLSDIVFYLRQVSKDKRIAKYINSVLHLRSDYESLDKDIDNIFSIEVKVNSATTNKQNWYSDLINLQESAGYKDVRLDFTYKRVKDRNGKLEKNIRGLGFARNIVGWLKKDDQNIEYIDDLKMTYQANGSDKIIDLDFLKNKVTSLLSIPLTDKFMYTPKDFNEIVGQEFNHYLSTGDTTT